VDLERPCPFWKEEGQCVFEGCAVCTCEEGEIPHAWMTIVSNGDNDADSGEYGWFSPRSSSFGDGIDGHDDVLGRLDLTGLPQSTSGWGYEQFLMNKATEEDEDDHGNVCIDVDCNLNFIILF